MRHWPDHCSCHTFSLYWSPPPSIDDPVSQRLIAFVDVVLPLDSVLDSHGDIKPGASARMVQRAKYTRMFAEDISDEIHFKYYTMSTWTDSHIREYVRKEAPLILLPRALDLFPRHRWTGAQEVLAATTLLYGTHGLLQRCVLNLSLPLCVLLSFLGAWGSCSTALILRPALLFFVDVVDGGTEKAIGVALC